MTKPSQGAAWSAFAVLAVLALAMVAAPAAAHEAPRPREFEVRLLQDCTDDYFGGDSPNRPGYDLHSLDVREVWQEGLGDAVALRVVANGEGQGRIELRFDAGGSTHEASWRTSSGSTWTGDGFDKVAGPSSARDRDGSPDGERFYLDGFLALDALGVTDGDRITHYSLTGYAGGEEGDRVPGYDDDRLTAPGCEGNTQRPPSQGYQIEGPIQYASLAVEPAEATLQPGVRLFVDLDVENLLRGTSDARVPDQEVTLTFSGGPGLQVDLHDPASGEYTQQATFTLEPRRSSVVHLAVVGEEPGAVGTVQITLTTEYGGRVVETFAYTVTDGASNGPTTTASGPDDSNGTPAVGLPVLVALLVALAFAARVRRP